jgi:Tautomerase enzyme
MFSQLRPVIGTRSSPEQKVAAYAELAKRLEAECGIRPEDLIISVMANRHVDWSFGLGQAQFLDGTLTSLDKPGNLSGQSVDRVGEEQYVAESHNAARS